MFLHKYNYWIIGLLCLAAVIVLTGLPTSNKNLPNYADGNSLFDDHYYLGKVSKVGATEIQNHQGVPMTFQKVSVVLTSGPETGREIAIDNGGGSELGDYQKANLGESVVVTKTSDLGESAYYISDKYRLPEVAMILAVFFILVVAMSRLRGFTSIIGLVISVLILAKFIVPRILAGQDPMLIGLAGAFAIAVLSIYAAHGLNKRTTVAVFSTLSTLAIAAIMSIVAVNFSRLFGLGSETAFYLQMGQAGDLNLRGLLLAGIIIGVLGLLDDVTTGQAAAVDEITKANPDLSFRELYKSGISVGREHITSLVNTLVLAYAGASLPLFLVFYLNQSQPLWVTLNTEFISEEVVRTLVGSITLVLAVPIATLLAAYFFSKKRSK